MQIKEVLQGIALTVGTLAVFTGLVLYAMAKFDIGGQGARGEKSLVECILAAIAAGAAAVYIVAQEFAIKVG